MILSLRNYIDYIKCAGDAQPCPFRGKGDAHSDSSPNCGKMPKAPFPGDVAGPVQHGKCIEACVAYPAESN